MQEVQATFNGSTNQTEDGDTWILVVNIIHGSFEDAENEMLYRTKDKCYVLAWKVIREAQEDFTLKKFISWKKEQIATLTNEMKRRADLAEDKALKREYNKLSIDKEGYLVRDSGSGRKQLVVPMKLRKVMYRELHINIGHLGPDRTVGLAR